MSVAEQVFQLLTVGMGLDGALRESLRTMIFAARVRLEQCSGSGRLAFEDLVNLCQETEARIGTIEPL